MLTRDSKSYREIRAFLDQVPVIDTHEHSIGVTKPFNNVLLELFVSQYFRSDLVSAGMDGKTSKLIEDPNADFDERYSAFEKFLKKTCHTAYANGIKAGLKECWGLEEISRETVLKLMEKMPRRNENFYKELTQRFKIKAAIADVFFMWGMDNYVNDPNPRFSEITRFAFSLPSYHRIKSGADIMRLQKHLDRDISCLDDYMEAFENCLKRYMEFGIVCIKDQSAYTRTIDYKQRSKDEAEKVFKAILKDKETPVSDSEALVLDDWLFHRFMDLAEKYNLPVQIHTGHLAGIRGNITRANAANFIPVLESHHGTMFDLFHGNWPFMDEILFIGKNFPNAYIDLCWVNSIDPAYCIELMKRAVMTVPHSKLFAFGGDTSVIELTIGYLTMARDNAAYALSELVDTGWINLREAMEIAADWFFNNPNEFFKLGFESFKPW